MNQKIFISIFIGFVLLITFLLLFLGLFMNGFSPSTSSNSDSGFPVIYLLLAVIAWMTVILVVLLRLRR